MIKIKVLYDCDDNNFEVLTIQQFVNKFNKAEINSVTDFILIVKE